MIGVHPGVGYETYAQWPGLRSSYLRHFRRTALHAREESLRPAEPSRALDLGNAVHAAILEPGRFETQYAPSIKVDRRFNEGKAAWAAHLALHAGKELLEPGEYDRAARIRDAVWRQPWAEALLGGGRGVNELSIGWDDPEFGVRCKARIDRYTPDFDGVPTVCDLKSSADASKDAFRRQVENLGYGLQAALYLDGLTAAAGAHYRRWLWIVVEKTPPYACALREPDDEVLEEGRRLYRTAIALHLECERSGFWPGYPPHPEIVGRPPWARRPQEEALM